MSAYEDLLQRECRLMRLARTSVGVEVSKVSANQRSAAFRTTLTAIGNNTGIVVPLEVLAELRAGKRPAVHVEVNGFRYESTVGAMNRHAMISVRAGIREQTGLRRGNEIVVSADAR
jgi:hypothetical protein